MYLLYSQMQHIQICHLFDEVNKPYIREKHDKLINKQFLNTVIFY